MQLLVFQALLLLVAVPARTTTVMAFAPSTSSASLTRTTHHPTRTTASSSKLHMVAPIIDDMESARTAFFIWFFGASGAAGIARSAFPRMFQSYRNIQKLGAESSDNANDETLGLPLLLTGYPKDLSIPDVKQIVNNPLSVEQIVQKYPVENNFLSKNGYLTFPAFAQANAAANPLAVRAVFDTFATSTDCVEPDKAQAFLDQYQQDVTAVKPALIQSKLVGLMAIFSLLFLLGFADVIAAGHAYHGWFPDWPGGQNFPACLLDPETGPWTIPQYWV